MNIPDPATLRKAIEITTQIERLQARLQALLAESLLANPKNSGRKSAPKTQKKSQVPEQPLGTPSNIASPSVEKDSLPLELEDQQPELLLTSDDGEEQLALVNSQQLVSH